jgi:hypothetical protein
LILNGNVPLCNKSPEYWYIALFQNEICCGLVNRVPGYTTEIYCVIPVRYELNLYMLCRRK